MKIAKKDITAIISGSVIWLFFALFAQKLVFLVLGEDLRTDPTYLWVFGFSISFFAALYVGWKGASKGWILGLINQVIVTILLVLFLQISSLADSISSKGIVGSLKSFLSYISVQLPWFLSAGIGGLFGQRFRK
jgi:hypothetical protein